MPQESSSVAVEAESEHLPFSSQVATRSAITLSSALLQLPMERSI